MGHRLIIAGLALAACQGDSGPIGKDAARPLKGHVAVRQDDRQHCRTQRPYEVAPHRTWKLLLSLGGGFACYRPGGFVVTFHEASKAPCDEAGVSGEGGAPISIEQARTEFQACSAMGKASSRTPTNVLIVFPVDGATEAQVAEYRDFATYLPQMIFFDGLPVTHFNATGQFACMETDRPEALFTHIEEAEIVDGTAVQTIELSSSSCRTAMPELAGHPWTEIVRMEVGPGTPFFGK